jgi:hypothetical protein
VTLNIIFSVVFSKLKARSKIVIEMGRKLIGNYYMQA